MLQIVYLLLSDQRIDRDRANKQGNTPFHLAVEHRQKTSGESFSRYLGLMQIIIRIIQV